MFLRIAVFLFLVVTIFQTNNGVDASYIDNVIKYCRNKERISARVDKYEKTSPKLNEPVMFPRQFPEVPQIEEISQNYFECIADTLNKSSDQDLYSSRRYRSLVQECKAVQPTTPYCDPSNPYRAINGTCNNLFHPKWGSTFGCFRRLYPANYEGVSGFRKSVQGKNSLPNTRDISRELVKPDIKLTQDFNALFALFGQVMAHDIAQFTFTTAEGDEELDCCKNSRYEQHSQCAPIYIDPTDAFYSAYNVDCFNFVRVIPCTTCSIGKRIPINGQTAWLDCSLVYGQIDEKAEGLRRKDGSGKLKSQDRGFGELMLANQSRGAACGNTEKEQYCFNAGDTRANQHTALMIFQTLLFREHNRIADRLKIINPHWDEDTLYQESRKILIAELQVIVYKEYLDVLLGPKIMSKYGLKIESGGNYNSFLDPSISVEFNGAAFRVHSILPSKVVFDEYFQRLRNLYINSVPIYNDRMSTYLYKMANIAGEKYDTFMPADVSWFLYKPLRGVRGFDLTAIDIQRGRDIGLPSYAQIIEYMEDRPGTIKTFDDLNNYITTECRNTLEKLYADVRDIDFYVGIICEKIPSDMIISPTAADIIAEQFARLKYGDRFYVEHDPTLTAEQRQELLTASLAKMICDNNDVEFIQTKAFLFPSETNLLEYCSEIPGVDLEKWREY